MENKYSLKFELGIALSIFSLPLSWSISHILGRNLSIITDFFMALSLILLLNLRKPIIRMRKIELLFIIYQTLVLFYILFCQNRPIVSELIYNGYTIAVLFILVIQKRNKEFSKLLYCFCVLGGIIILVTFLYATNFFTVWSWKTRFSLADSGDPLTLSDRIMIAMIAFYLWKPDKLLLKPVKYLFILMGVVGILATGVRKTLLIIPLLLVLNFYYSMKTIIVTQKTVFKAIKSIIIMIFAVIVLIIVLNKVPGIRDSLSSQLDFLAERTISGIQSYSGNEMTDVSAMTRVALRKQVIQRWLADDGLLEILFGHGYIETYVDVPIIQIFSDLGIFLGIIYVFFSLILPLKIILEKKGTLDINIRLMKLMVAPILINQFVSGVPYGYRFWLPLTYLLALVDNKSSVIRINKLAKDKLKENIIR